MSCCPVPRRVRHRRQARALPAWLLAAALAAGCAGAAEPPRSAAGGLAQSDPLAAHFKRCEAWPGPDGVVILECPQRGLSLRIGPTAIDVALVRDELLGELGDAEAAAPLDGLGAEQVVVRIVAGPDAHGPADLTGLMAIAATPDGNRLSTCSQRIDTELPFDEAFCRESMRLLLADGGGRSLLPSHVDFAGRTLELGAEGCWADRPGTLTCTDGAQLSWTTGSAQRVEALLLQSPLSVTHGLLGRGARHLDEQSPPCRIDDAEADCHVVRVASGRDVIITVFATAPLRERHVFVECSYAVDDAGPEIDPWLPPVCAGVLTMMP